MKTRLFSRAWLFRGSTKNRAVNRYNLYSAYTRLATAARRAIPLERVFARQVH